MTAAVTHLLDEALRLPDRSRIELAERILDSTPPPADVIAKQMTIVRKRMANVRAGQSRLIPAEEAHELVRQALKSGPKWVGSGRDGRPLLQLDRYPISRADSFFGGGDV